MRPGAFRPSSWSWTTAAAVVIVIGLIVPITAAATALEPPRVATTSGAWEGTAEIVGRGWVLAAIPSALAFLVAWRVRRRQEDRDLEGAAGFGVTSVAVLGCALLIGILRVPGHPEPRLVALTAMFVVGLALLGASLWLRHVPRR
jgi:hypothetical protein